MFANSITTIKKFAYLGLVCAICVGISSAIPAEAAKQRRHSRKPAAIGPMFKPTDANLEKLTLPSADQLAGELKIDPKEFSQVVDTFANALTSGRTSKPYKLLCAKKESACALLADYFAQQDLQRSERTHHKAREKRIKPFRLSKSQAQEAQKMPYLVLVQRVVLTKESDLVPLAHEAFETKTCPRNLSAALAIRVEEYFPGSTARTLAKQLFEHARECMTKDDPAFERLNLRQGLYALYDGNRERAEHLLNDARDATVSSEKYRILYWLGKIAESKGTKPEKNVAWQELITHFPLSFYSIAASVSMGRDPMSAVTNHKVGGINRNSTNPQQTESIRWLESLYALKKNNAVAKWASWIVKDSEDIDVDVLQYISTIKIAAGLYRSNIATLFNYFRTHPSELNNEGLRLLYPRPYYEIVAEASRNKIDSFFVFGLMRQESAFDPGAVSRTRAQGLMQIEPSTARRLAHNGQRRLMNIGDNTSMGVKYLLNLSERFSGKMELVLAGYNAGPNKVDEWMKRNPDRSDVLLWNDLIPYMETRDYVISILRNNYFYIKLYGSDDDANRKLAANNSIYSSELVTQLLLSRH